MKAQRCGYEANNVAQNTSPLTTFERSATLFNLVHLILEQTNLYVVQNGREFQTIPDGMHAFLSLNYMMPVWKLAIIKCYWAADDYIGSILYNFSIPLFCRKLNGLQVRSSL